jgi:alpha-galactosidase
MPRIAFIGAGSTVFTRNLIGDVLRFPELRDSTFALMDIDPERLRTSASAARELGAARVEPTLDRRQALTGADYVITSFQVGGLSATRLDFDVPKRHGLRQTIADTVGIGGIMRGLRTIPVLLEVCRDIEELCPDALLLQYVNPMAMLCWAVSAASPVRCVGLCHSVQHTAAELAHDLGVPADEVEYRVAGINHLAFFLRLERAGQDLYPALREVSPPETNLVRYEVLRHLGYFVTESSEHFAEYVPWFIKRDRADLVERFNIPLDEYVRRSEALLEDWDRPSASDGPSLEYGADIIRARETGEPFRFNGNVPNRHAGGLLIDNLPADCCVEVPCLATGRGIEPERVGALPRHLAALMQTNVSVQGLTVEAALTGSREAVHHAAMLDPHTAAELSLAEIAALVDELLAAHGL